MRRETSTLRHVKAEPGRVGLGWGLRVGGSGMGGGSGVRVGQGWGVLHNNDMCMTP